MDHIDALLERYEMDLNKADEGKCKKVSQCSDFRGSFQQQYESIYKPKLEAVKDKLLDRAHSAKIEEKSSEEIFYGFTLSIIPRHLHRNPVDRYYPSSLWSSIEFLANEHTLTVDVETVLRPNIETEKSRFFEKIPRNQFNEDLLMEKIEGFIEKVFEETIILDFRTS